MRKVDNLIPVNARRVPWLVTEFLELVLSQHRSTMLTFFAAGESITQQANTQRHCNEISCKKHYKAASESDMRFCAQPSFAVAIWRGLLTLDQFCTNEAWGSCTFWSQKYCACITEKLWSSWDLGHERFHTYNFQHASANRNSICDDLRVINVVIHTRTTHHIVTTYRLYGTWWGLDIQNFEAHLYRRRFRHAWEHEYMMSPPFVADSWNKQGRFCSNSRMFCVWQSATLFSSPGWYDCDARLDTFTEHARGSKITYAGMSLSSALV